jgi:ubiquinone/menaquinone biosynthesis C-methylase UbiE
VSDAQREALRSLFDTVAGGYDQVGVDFFQPIAAGLVAELDPQPGERGLDLGCGRGAALLPIARAVGPSGRAVGGDLSPDMVTQAAAVADREGLTQVEALVVDAQEPDLGGYLGDGFDLLSASLVLDLLPDPAAALVRWRGLARPGSRVGVSTFRRPDLTWDPVDRLFEPYVPQPFRDARRAGESGPFQSDTGVEGLFTDAGWADARTTTLALPVRFDDADHWYRFTMSTGLRGFWGLVPEAELAGIRDEARRIMGATAAPDGSVTFTQRVRYTLARSP